MPDRSFYERDAVEVARALLGKLLTRRTPDGDISGMIVETEAYSGICDAACHAYPYKRTPRTQILFGAGGHAYVYLIYGMYHCFNVVANKPGEPEGVLIRALEPVGNTALMQRGNGAKKNLCAGPGRLCRALGIELRHCGLDLCADGELFISDYSDITPGEITATPRINIDYAGEARFWPWRFLISGNPHVSVLTPSKRQKSK